MFDKSRLNGYNKQCIGLGKWIKASSKADICVLKIRRYGGEVLSSRGI